jgi:hypothetical protein
MSGGKTQFKNCISQLNSITQVAESNTTHLMVATGVGVEYLREMHVQRVLVACFYSTRTILSKMRMASWLHQNGRDSAPSSGIIHFLETSQAQDGNFSTVMQPGCASPTYHPFFLFISLNICAILPKLSYKKRNTGVLDER